MFFLLSAFSIWKPKPNCFRSMRTFVLILLFFVSLQLNDSFTISVFFFWLFKSEFVEKYYYGKKASYRERDTKSLKVET